MEARPCVGEDQREESGGDFSWATGIWSGFGREDKVEREDARTGFGDGGEGENREVPPGERECSGRRNRGGGVLPERETVESGQGLEEGWRRG